MLQTRTGDPLLARSRQEVPGPPMRFPYVTAPAPTSVTWFTQRKASYSVVHATAIPNTAAIVSETPRTVPAVLVLDGIKTGRTLSLSFLD
jgi:hypothetical protein